MEEMRPHSRDWKESPERRTPPRRRPSPRDDFAPLGRAVHHDLPEPRGGGVRRRHRRWIPRSAPSRVPGRGRDDRGRRGFDGGRRRRRPEARGGGLPLAAPPPRRDSRGRYGRRLLPLLRTGRVRPPPGRSRPVVRRRRGGGGVVGDLSICSWVGRGDRSGVVLRLRRRRRRRRRAPVPPQGEVRAIGLLPFLRGQGAPRRRRPRKPREGGEAAARHRVGREPGVVVGVQREPGRRGPRPGGGAASPSLGPGRGIRGNVGRDGKGGRRRRLGRGQLRDGQRDEADERPIISGRSGDVRSRPPA